MTNDTPSRAILLALTFATAAGVLHQRHTPEGIEDGDQKQNWVSDYEIGLLWDEAYGTTGGTPCLEAQMHQNIPPPEPELVDLTKPCAMMRAYFANCSLGLSLEQEGQSRDVDYLPTEFAEQANDKQQQCYCSGDYWLYNAGCNACLQYHGFEVGGAGWIVPGYISQQSELYCSGKPTLNFREFLSAFTPTQTLVSPPTSIPFYINDTATAASQTGVSAYFTAPSETPTFLSGTAPVTLGPYIETTTLAAPTPTTPTHNAASRVDPILLHWIMMIGALLAA